MVAMTEIRAFAAHITEEYEHFAGGSEYRQALRDDETFVRLAHCRHQLKTNRRFHSEDHNQAVADAIDEAVDCLEDALDAQAAAIAANMED